MFASWLPPLVQRLGRTPQRRQWTARLRAAGLPPRLEVLEHRLAPATLTVNSAGDNNTYDSFLTLREAVLLVDHGRVTARLAARRLSFEIPGDELAVPVSDLFRQELETVDSAATPGRAALTVRHTDRYVIGGLIIVGHFVTRL
jgi:hypothetical protein